MPKRKKRPPGKAAKRSSRRRGQQTRRDANLLDEVRALLDTGQAWPLLEYTSTLLNLVDDRNRSPLGRAEPETSLDDVLDTLFAVETVETSALLTAIASLTGDGELRTKVRREIATRADVLPHWLVELDRTVAGDRVLIVSDVLGDGDDFVVEVEVPGGEMLTAIVYVDHNMGTAVNDAFVVPEPLEVAAAGFLSIEDPDVTVTDIPPADARARISGAIEHGARMWPPPLTESWPSSRPLVEWMVGRLPAGGAGYEFPEWSEGERQELASRFLRSPFAAGLQDDAAARLVDDLVWYGTDYGIGDPLRWSPTRVEILLADWLPRKIVAPVEVLTRAPEVLRAFIRFGHAEIGIRQELTDECLDAVAEWEPEYQQAIRSPRHQGPEALLAAMGVLDEPPGDPSSEDEPPRP